MKKITFALIAFFIGINCFGQNTSDFKYRVYAGFIWITEYTGSEKNISIPGTINSVIVSGVDGLSFSNKGLTRVILPNTLMGIGQAVFAENSLREIIIPDAVISMGNAAFYGNQLTSVYISQNLTKIAQGAFYGNQLTGIQIPDNITIIEDNAFSANPIQYIIIGSNVTISQDSFEFNFVSFYNQNNKREGFYTYRNNKWEFKSRLAKSNFDNLLKEWENIINESTIAINKWKQDPSDRNMAEPVINLLLNNRTVMFQLAQLAMSATNEQKTKSLELTQRITEINMEVSRITGRNQ
jgi:hypothetical protein